jgi:hypothetical protein
MISCVLLDLHSSALLFRLTESYFSVMELIGATSILYLEGTVCGFYKCKFRYYNKIHDGC